MEIICYIIIYIIQILKKLLIKDNLNIAVNFKYMNNETVFEKDGKKATIFLPENEIEEETTKQLSQIITNESVSNIKLMPDSHVGHGCIVGFTAQIDIDKINPNFIGGDIFCGILTYPLFDKKLNYQKMEKKS